MIIRLNGYVDEQGHVTIEGTVDLPPGPIEVELRQYPTLSSLEEVKQWIEDTKDRELTPEQIEAYHRLNQEFLDMASDDLDLPPDYADEIDHYLYGTPKRSESKDQD